MADFIKLKEEKPKRKTRFNFMGILIFVLVLFLISSLISSISFALSPKIAVVPIKGAISTQGSVSIFGETISSREIAQTLQDLDEDSSVKAIILDINSPGGSAVASEEISRAIEKVKTNKPVYAIINDMGASGGFWVAVSADKVYASPMSMVGSIGVTSAGLGFEDFIKEYNITYRRLVAGEYKDMGTPFRNMTLEEELKIQEMLDEIHLRFIEHIATSRNMTSEQVKTYATGEIFLGTKAKEIGFIDEIGYYPDVVEELRNKTSKNAIIVDYGPQPTLLDVIGLSSVFESPKAESQIMLK